MTGKWSQKGVPQKGWTCTDVDDLGEPAETCEMCEAVQIRYVHYMTHPGFEGTLAVGCVCAERMEDDYTGPRRREQALKGAATRRGRWLLRKWQRSRAGNSYINTDGFNITIYAKAGGGWGGRILERTTNRAVEARRQYQTEDAAKLGAFTGMIFLKGRGWGTPKRSAGADPAGSRPS